MQFIRGSYIDHLDENETYTGKIIAITKVQKNSYYKVKVKMNQGIIEIWVYECVTNDHPLYPVLDFLINNGVCEEENIDEQKMINTEIEFTVKNIETHGKNGILVEHMFFDKVTPIVPKEDIDNE